MSASTPYLIGYITHNNLTAARTLASSLLSKNLIACCNLIPKIESIYMWKGEVCQDEEILLLIKTHRDFQQQIIDLVQKEHGYETPEIIFTEVVSGSEKYLAWVDEVTRGKMSGEKKEL